MDIDKLKALIKPEEGFRSKPYRDIMGILTIGYGRNLQSVGIRPEEADHLNRTQEDIEENGLTEHEADYLLENDIKNAIDDCQRAFAWFDSLNETRQMVVVDMVFNMGLRKFRGFRKTIDCISKGDFEGASREMLDSTWATQVGKRATVLADMMRKGGL